MPETIAIQEGVILILDKSTSEPIALIRRNGSIQWFTLKETSWDDMVQITGANKSL